MGRGSRYAPGALVLCWSLFACSGEDQLRQLEAQLQVPEQFDLGSAQLGWPVKAQIPLRNLGALTAQLTSPRLVSAADLGEAEYQIDSYPEYIAPGETGYINLSLQVFRLQELPHQASLELSIEFPGYEPLQKKMALTANGVESSLQFLPQPLDFGPVLPGQGKELLLRVKNLQNSAQPLYVGLDSSGVPLVNHRLGRGRFEIIAPQVNLVAKEGFGRLFAAIEPGETKSLTLRYRPEASLEESTDEAYLNFFNCLDPVCRESISVQGRGTMSMLACTPEQVDFGMVNPGADSLQSLSCQNMSSQPLIVTGWSLALASDSAFYLGAELAAPRSLAPAETISVKVGFAPTEAHLVQPSHGVLLVSGRIPGVSQPLLPARVPLQGSTGGPDIVVKPAELRFGPVVVGTERRMSLAVENQGNRPLDISALALKGASQTEFLFTQRSMSIRPGETREVELRFKPSHEGLQTDSLLIESNDQDSLLKEVPLQGSGNLSTSCQYTLDTTELRFGAVDVLRAKTRAVRLTNTGMGPCKVSGPVFVSGQEKDFRILEGPVLGEELLPGGSKLFSFEFRPETIGNQQAELLFYVGATQHAEREVRLSGSGATEKLLFSPGDIHFGPVAVDCRARSKVLEIYNASLGSQTIERVSFAGGAASRFSLEAPLPQFPVRLRPGDSLSLSLRYSPGTIGPEHDALYIYSPGTREPYVVSLFGSGSQHATNQEKFQQLSTPEVDILFVIDNSCSMETEQASLAANFNSFIAAAEQQDLNYRIGVISTDMTGCPYPAQTHRPAGLAQGACGYFADGAGARTGGPRHPDWRMIDPGEQPSVAEAFSAVATQGTGGSGIEKGLEAAYAALSSPRITHWNRGFLRRDAYLALIFISDEDDHSPRSLQFYLQAFRASKGRAAGQLFTASAIVGDLPDGCGPGIAAPGHRYAALARQTGGIVASICTSNWSSALSRLGLSVFGYKSRFFLSNQPVPGTVRLMVDGLPVNPQSPSGQRRWRYDASSNSVVFHPIAIPEPGSQIDVSYEAQCL